MRGREGLRIIGDVVHVEQSALCKVCGFLISDSGILSLY